MYIMSSKPVLLVNNKGKIFELLLVFICGLLQKWPCGFMALQISFVIDLLEYMLSDDLLLEFINTS